MTRSPRWRAAGAIAAALALVFALGAGGCATRADHREKVVLWHAYSGAEKAALAKVVGEFNAKSRDLRVVLVSVPYGAFADKITNAIPNGNGPDLFIFAHDRIGDWVSAGVIEPIEYYVDDALADHYEYGALAAMAYKGSLYGLPLAVKSLALFYRTDLVDHPPASTDALVSWGKKFVHDGAGKRYALAYQNGDLYGHAAWLHGFGGHVFGKDGSLAVDDAASVRAAVFARSLVQKGLVPTSTTAEMVSTLFRSGKAALAISGPWFISDIGKGVPWKVTSLPVVSATGKRAAPFLGAEGVLMSSRAHDKDAAFRVMRMLAGDHSAIIRARMARQVVPNKAAYSEPDIGGDPVLAAFRRQLAHTVPMPATPAMRTVWTPYQTALQKIIVDGADPHAALASAKREIATYIRGGAR